MSTTITPTEARAQLNWLYGCNEVGTEDAKAKLRAILRAADEVEETDPAKMLATADWLEGLAAEYDAEGLEFRAAENREAAARYRRCAARATADQGALQVSTPVRLAGLRTDWFGLASEIVLRDAA